MKFRNIPLIFLILLPYLIFFPVIMGCLKLQLVDEAFNLWSKILIPVIFPLAVIVPVVNLILGLRSGAPVRELAFQSMLIKLIHIPYFLYSVILGLGFMLLIPPLLLFDGLLVYASSAYGIRALQFAEKDGTITRKQRNLHMVLHLLFVADVFSAVWLYRKLKNKA